jgi:hypothetical protein
MIRYLYIIIDTTKSMKEHDLKPSRIGITQIHLKVNLIDNLKKEKKNI